ncbi:hypothetical protein MMC12_002698 [Toensbergia leucococca]|nr:hypothetical protein [Toensbergia leucococca]
MVFSKTHPHHTPKETWRALFTPPPHPSLITTAAASTTHTTPTAPTLFSPSPHSSHLEILRILSENPPDTITIIAIGPLTTLALAASHSPQTFLRAKEVLVMGGCFLEPGNITPVAEFNAIADATAAARIFALTSPNPASTMPPSMATSEQASEHDLESFLPPYPSKEELGERRLNLVLFPLDITTPHTLLRTEFEAKVQPLLRKGSPLAEWTSAFLGPTFTKMETLHLGHEGDSTALSLHDPMCVWYALTTTSSEEEEAPSSGSGKNWTIGEGEDVRLETAGQWTRGMCVVDRRDRKKMVDVEYGAEEAEVPGDRGGWLSSRAGNRVRRCVGTPGERALAPFMLDAIFG